MRGGRSRRFHYILLLCDYSSYQEAFLKATLTRTIALDKQNFRMLVMRFKGMMVPLCYKICSTLLCPMSDKNTFSPFNLDQRYVIEYGARDI